ncbi:hypothetical protein [Nocardioides marmoribigeumensis]|jgi:hypothetical protein|uniref:Uncharacterized protein n=1 Tax=Nocardioides marmoribigeumensis TaxID=433649 RepID=A0ABU2BUG6_9ACTN|nr:hypothetical protein [Nocardioides marmoribigeumensis]MDR7362274.1 hypothetical protein [Nocardioides marmoribigeumensis]
MRQIAGLAAALTLSTVAVGAAVLGPAVASAEPAQVSDGHAVAGAQNATLAQLKKALRPFQDSPAAAEAAGYEPSTTCVAAPMGGMGYHYVNLSLAMQPADPMHPAVLVYVPGDDGRLALGAAEWFKVDEDQDLSTDGDRPALFGRDFDGPMLGHEPGMPTHYDLHAWLFQPNPKGVFQPWNPTVSC